MALKVAPRKRRRIITPDFIEITNDPLSERRVFLENRPNSRFKFTAEESVKRAQDQHTISRAFERAGIPSQRVLKRTLNLTAQDFVHGTPLGDTPSTRNRLNQIARLLARMHQIPQPRTLLKETIPELRRQIGRVTRKLGKLNVLDPIERKRLGAHLRQRIPRHARTVLTHRDVTRDNTFKQGKKIVLIDIGDAGLDFVGLELARTIYNQRLTENEIPAFLKAYRRYGGDPTPYLSHQEFWDTYIRSRKLRSSAQRKNQKRRVKREKKSLLERLRSSK
ncbi:MAG: phosphotransferase [Candidatus Diapherotrites archaeon]|nr:phosphotransferase [Candidatus Diapherotrites archaeon]